MMPTILHCQQPGGVVSVKISQKGACSPCHGTHVTSLSIITGTCMYALGNGKESIVKGFALGIVMPNHGKEGNTSKYGKEGNASKHGKEGDASKHGKEGNASKHSKEGNASKHG